MKTLTLNVTTAVTSVYTVPVTNETYNTLLTMAANDASDDTIWDYLEEHVDDTVPIEDYESKMVNAVTVVKDDMGNATIINTVTEGNVS